MDLPLLHALHQKLNAQFTKLNGKEAVLHYGDPLAEHAALRGTAGVLDLGFRSRLCLLGADRQKFLNGQVTNNVKDLQAGQGCYAALVSAKGKMQSDLNIHCLENEILLDFEPGLSEMVTQRLERYVIADDVRIVDVAPHYGLLSVQGSRSSLVVEGLGLNAPVPQDPMCVSSIHDAALGEIYLVNHARLGGSGFDVFVPNESLGDVAGKLIASAASLGGRACGWQAFEVARIEAGIPRFGVDMDETNLAPETGIEPRAISYSKGCYIGQEVIARIRTYGQVAKALRGLRLPDLKALPIRGDKLFQGEKEVGYITSAARSPALQMNIALGYVRKEANAAGTNLTLRAHDTAVPVQVVELPFK